MRIFITDQSRQPDWRMIISHMNQADKVIIRDYAHPNRPELAAEIANHCQKNRIKCAVAGDWRLAWALKTGLHWPSNMARGRSIPIRPRQFQTMAVHNTAELARAIFHRVDYALISPIFETQTHAIANPIGPRGLYHLAALAKANNIVPVALGGVTLETVQRLRPVLGRRPNLAAIDGIHKLSSLYF